ncbi:MAG: PAS domain-containing protein [Alphaproteobacteria bacterium]|nr:PAS domain-containing protein [Alphaproteobacteria bacterium]
MTQAPINTGEMAPLTLASGEEAFVSMYDLGDYPGTLIVLQRQQDVLSAWRSSVTQVTALFIVTFFVLMLLGAAFHWQGAKAAEADSILGVATARLDKALDRGQCGMWDWDVNRGIIFWSRSMFDMLGMPVKGDYLSFGEMAARIHESDTQLEEAVEQLLDGQITSFDQEFRMRHQDGHYVWLRARVALAPGEVEGNPHLMGIVFDITQQKLADTLTTRSRTSRKPSCCGMRTTGWCCAIPSTSSSIHCPLPSAFPARPMKIWCAPPRNRPSPSAPASAAKAVAKASPSRCSSPTAAGCRSTSAAPRTVASCRSAPTSPR